MCLLTSQSEPVLFINSAKSQSKNATNEQSYFVDGDLAELINTMNVGSKNLRTIGKLIA